MAKTKKYIIAVFLILTLYVGFVQNSSRNYKNTVENVLSSIDQILKVNNNVLAQADTRDPAQLLSRAINGEARGEPYIGQVAVGAVILNRVKHPSFPKSIASVIYQPGAFTAVSDGQINVPLSATSAVFKASKDALNGWDPTGGCIYYYNPATATNKWIWSRTVVTTIGKHKFAK